MIRRCNKNNMKKVTSYKLQVTRKSKSHSLATCHLPLATDSGYTLLFAMIVASIVLALGVSILTISRKEFILSSSATQSTNAFYAADSGLGCAEYWANTSGPNEFATSTTVTQTNMTCSSSGSQITVYVCKSGDSQCSDPYLDNKAPTDISDNSSGTYEFTFYVPFSTDGTLTNYSCAAVTVDRYYSKNPNLSNIEYPYTDITSAGFNIGWHQTSTSGVPLKGDCSTISPKKVNRTIELTY